MARFILSIICIVLFISSSVKAQNLFQTDTFTYTINLDLSKNNYLKSIPVDLLKGYCKGEWNAFYPAKEMNQCLFNDFLNRFSYAEPQSVDSNSCLENYCDDSYFKDLYSRFSRKLKYREIVYFDKKHSYVKRELLWLQVYYSVQDADTWKHHNGPVFWLNEIKKSIHPVMVQNKDFSNQPRTMDHTFMFPAFIVNENKQKGNTKKVIIYNQTEEN
ncbi:MAG: hypothetical protein IPM95_01010 [Sphingobacteriales bacterium]|nr:hypothetical protein [Sphingobacteriales bacterium]